MTRSLGPIETEERLLRAVAVTVDRGYCYSLVDGSIYWRSPSQSLWTPVQVIAFLFYSDRPVWVDFDSACVLIGLPDELKRKFKKAIYPQNGFNKQRRQLLMEACQL